jgi:glycosyltransferase involved in cell wall biosynthesis
MMPSGRLSDEVPPLVTVLMPVFNGARHLRSAIDSILAQTFTDFEFLIVNDGSLDESRAIAASYPDSRIRIIDHERNLGLSTALNRGLDDARGRLIARQDADDVSMPERLARQVEFLREHGAIALVGTQGRVIDEAGEFVGVVDRPLDEASIRWYGLWDNPFIHTSVMFRPEAVMKAGGFEAEFDPFSQDYALWSRVLMANRVANLAARLIHYRISSSSITGDMNLPEFAAADRRRSEFVPILRRIIDRNLRGMFGASAIADDDVVLAAGFVTGLPPNRVPAFLRLFFSLLNRYQETLDHATRGAMRRTVARQIDTLAYRVTGADRRTALAVYASAARHDPKLLRELPWPRVLALAACGASGRGAVKRFSLFRRFVARYL